MNSKLQIPVCTLYFWGLMYLNHYSVHHFGDLRLALGTSVMALLGLKMFRIKIWGGSSLQNVLFGAYLATIFAYLI